MAQFQFQVYATTRVNEHSRVNQGQHDEIPIQFFFCSHPSARRTDNSVLGKAPIMSLFEGLHRSEGNFPINLNFDIFIFKRKFEFFFVCWRCIRYLIIE